MIHIKTIVLFLLFTLIFTVFTVKADIGINDYSPYFNVTYKKGNKRSIGEIDFMFPVWSKDSHLSILDLKTKLDGNRNKEVNVGIAHRYNYDDKVILGGYGYYDYRRSVNNFNIRAITTGVELLSKYLDFRANYYIPLNKVKKVKHKFGQVQIEGNNIKAVFGGHTYEYAYGGYDLELGVPLFMFSDDANEVFPIKLFATNYVFKNNGTKKISGRRYRLEYKLGEIDFHNSNFIVNVTMSTQKDKIRRRQNLFGLNIRVALNKKLHRYGLAGRMMDEVVRDVDIVTSTKKSDKYDKLFTLDGKEVSKIYYVGKSCAPGYKGNGTVDFPYSIEQLASIDSNNGLVIIADIDPMQGGEPMTPNEYDALKNNHKVANGMEKILKAGGLSDESLSLKIGNSVDGLFLHTDSDRSVIIKDGKEEVNTYKLSGNPRILTNGELQTRENFKQRQHNIAHAELGGVADIDYTQIKDTLDSANYLLLASAESEGELIEMYRRYRMFYNSARGDRRQQVVDSIISLISKETEAKQRYYRTQVLESFSNALPVGSSLKVDIEGYEF